MQKLLFMFFAVGCVYIYNIQAEESQVVELESTTEQVEANETPVMKKNKRTFRPNVACPTHVNCKTFLKFQDMNKRLYGLH
jgi:hypothetical protein